MMSVFVYSYSYSDEELQEWLPRINQLDQESPLTLVYMNNRNSAKLTP